MDSEQIIVIGSSTPLAQGISSLKKDTLFLGRTNPHGFSSWTQIPGQETRTGIQEGVEALKRQLNLVQDKKEVHLVCLQGLSSQDWDKSFNVNLLSVALHSECLGDYTEDKGLKGSITLIASASSYIGGKATYASTKAALFGLMNSLQGKYKNVRINLILPGAFEGGMTADWDEDKRNSIGSQAIAGRLATSEEIAHAIVFCIDNKYVSRSVINMTSGRVTIA